MTTLVRTLVRLMLHNQRRHESAKRNADDINYNLEINIYFDNAFEKRNTKPKRDVTSEKMKFNSKADFEYKWYEKGGCHEWKVLNQFVKRFIRVMETVLEQRGLIDAYRDAQVFTTPYGGKFVYNIAGTTFCVNLKDADEVQRGKRWSQIMYLYSLFGYKLDGCQMKNKNDKLITKGNAYLHALDGDVDFEPIDFELVLARMVRNPDVAACCNQIHPQGSGPLVWFQRFEYAVGHWFQKASEHVLGCVLCSPGCFSLVRVSFLMQDNVMALYKSLATNARNKLMYDQGEDRWLCTLMLLSGGRIEFEA